MSGVKSTREAPSYFEADILRIGFKSGGWAKAGASRVVGGKFVVADMTDDDDTDFYVSSTIIDREDVTDYFDDGYRANFGLWKAGPGTVELTGENCNAPAGVFKMEEGTVRFGDGASGKLGALMVIGDSTIECAGGSMEFSDSSAIDWTEGKTLDIVGDLHGPRLRFGTDANGLTAAQLASISYEGKFGKVFLSETGYLHTNDGTLILFR